MGNVSSKTILAPKTLAQCFDNDSGTVNQQAYFLYKRYKRRKKRNDDMDEFIQQCVDEAHSDINYGNNHPVQDRKPRSYFRKNMSLRRNVDGEVVEI
jgi:hypothetical protein